MRQGPIGTPESTAPHDDILPNLASFGRATPGGSSPDPLGVVMHVQGNMAVAHDPGFGRPAKQLRPGPLRACSGRKPKEAGSGSS
jgi:hypothetical protein